MVVQHNLQAMNANRMLNVTTGNQSKSTEKLSSGYKINRAADDAAGLSISEKMRKQIRGLDQASSNAQDGVSAVQTAEGALTEVHSMIQRMNELAVQAANGTNSKSDRDSIQDEIQQLTKEIDRVAETTKFNEIFLLKGDVEGETATVNVGAHDAGLTGKITDNGDGTSTFKYTGSLEVGSKVTIGGKDYTIAAESDPAKYADIRGDVYKSSGGSYTAASGHVWTSGDKNYTYLAAGDKDANGKEIATGNAGWYQDADSTNSATTLALKAGDIINGQTLVDGGDKLAGGTVGGDTLTAIDNVSDVAAAIKKMANDANLTIKDAEGNTLFAGKIAPASNGTNKITADEAAKLVQAGGYVTDGTSKIYVIGNDDGDATTITREEALERMAKAIKDASDIGADAKSTVTYKQDGTFEIIQGKVSVKKPLSFNLHVGSDAAMSNKISVDIETMSAANLGIKGINVSDETGIAATYAIDAIADALAKVSQQRSSLGAIQNRLEHSIANLDNVVENTTSAESRIRDTDMAEEMVEYSKNNILAQAGQSMLAQANQSTQGVMSLLQ